MRAGGVGGRRGLWWLACAVAAALASAGLLVFSASGQGAVEGWLERGDQLASIGSLLLTAVGVVVAVAAWRTMRSAPTDGAALLDAARDELARLVARQWSREVAMRGLLRPDPIRVRWSATGRPVTASVGVEAGAGGRAGSPARPRLRGDVTGIAATWRGLPGRQLVIIGGPGSGKTTAAVLLTRGLLADRSPAEPVPVLLSMASWNPLDQHLDTWLASRLALEYPVLASGGHYGQRPAAELVDRERVLPVLDGLDEMPAPLRAEAVTGINAAMGSGRPVVLTCRTQEYEQVITATGVPLARAAVLEIEPVSGQEAAEYLPAGGTDQTRRRWAPVVDHLREHPGGALALALSTPLMVYLARTVYSAPGRQPAGLTSFAGQERVEHHLLSQYLPAVYAPRRPAPDGRPALRAYQPDRARRWLAFLARHLGQQGSPDLAWWRLHRALPRHRLVCGLVAGLVSGVLLGITFGFASGPGYYAGRWFDPTAALLSGPLFGLVVGARVAARLARPAAPGPGSGSPASIRLRRTLVGLWSGFSVTVVSVFVLGIPAGLIFGIAAGLVFAGRVTGHPPPPAAPQRINLSPGRIAAGVAAGIAAGLTLELVATAAGLVELVPGLVDGLLYGLVLGLLSGLVVGLGTPVTRTELLDPLRTLRRDRTVLLLFGAVFGVAFALVSAVQVDNRVAGPDRSVWFGSAFGLAVGLVLGLGLAWVCFTIVRCWCAIRGELPWRTMRFLDDAARRGVLRRVGAEYQFRHLRLQEHLAGLARPGVSSPPGQRGSGSPPL